MRRGNTKCVWKYVRNCNCCIWNIFYSLFTVNVPVFTCRFKLPVNYHEIYSNFVQCTGRWEHMSKYKDKYGTTRKLPSKAEAIHQNSGPGLRRVLVWEASKRPDCYSEGAQMRETIHRTTIAQTVCKAGVYGRVTRIERNAVWVWWKACWSLSKLMWKKDLWSNERKTDFGYKVLLLMWTLNCSSFWETLSPQKSVMVVASDCGFEFN